MANPAKSLLELWEDHKNPESDSMRGSKRFSHAYFLVVTLTVPFALIYDVVPSQFGDSEPEVRYWLKIFIVFVAVETLANWLCCQLYSSVLVGTKDRATIDKTLWEAESSSEDPTKNPDFCKKCDLVAPYGSKTHHCKVCNACILRRDHHCFMVGTCIGYNNQRYFAILAFYVALGSILGFYYFYKQLVLMSAERTDARWIDYIIPLTFIKVIRGQMMFLELVELFYCYTFFFCSIMGVGFFCIQMGIITMGLTFNEAKHNKKAPLHRTISQNFNEVFGPFWMLNFLLPMQLVFRPKEFDMPLIMNGTGSPALNGHHKNGDISDLLSISVQ